MKKNKKWFAFIDKEEHFYKLDFKIFFKGDKKILTN